ncbi:hypothetical protein ACFY6E_12370 [Staphylococcus cohnii]|uniref:hypothetical protein n=1 Tax=Staphylococcus cohnii TaxID=29382 RepID=UPI003685FB37
MVHVVNLKEKPKEDLPNKTLGTTPFRYFNKRKNYKKFKYGNSPFIVKPIKNKDAKESIGVKENEGYFTFHVKIGTRIHQIATLTLWEDGTLDLFNSVSEQDIRVDNHDLIFFELENASYDLTLQNSRVIKKSSVTKKDTAKYIEPIIMPSDTKIDLNHVETLIADGFNTNDLRNYDDMKFKSLSRREFRHFNDSPNAHQFSVEKLNLKQAYMLNDFYNHLNEADEETIDIDVAKIIKLLKTPLTYEQITNHISKDEFVLRRFYDRLKLGHVKLEQLKITDGVKLTKAFNEIFK